MQRKWIVLIGPPAAGKTSLSHRLKEYFNANCYSFDIEFPLELLKYSSLDSKSHRKQFLDKIIADESEWIIIDDTCHFKSMQKRYLHISEENTIKLIFLFISVANDEIPELKERNMRRGSNVKNEELEKMTKRLNTSKLEWKNLIEYNFKQLPSIENIVDDIQKIIKDYQPRIIEQARVRDLESDASFYNRLNLALNKEISFAFRNESGPLDGKQISKAKKKLLCGYFDDHSDDFIEELVIEFRDEYLQK